MDTDLIARLREAAHYADEFEGERELLTEAADALETKDGQIEALELEMKVRLPIQEYKAHLKARIAELEARTVLTHGTVDMMVTEYPKLRSRIAALEAALKPFIEAEALKHTVSTGTSYEHTIWEICVSEAAFRAAYAAYRR